MSNLRATQTGTGWDVDDTKSGPVSAELDGNGRPTGRMLTDDGQVVGGAVRSLTNVYGRKHLGAAVATAGTSVHQMRSYVPFGGMLVDVALEIYSGSTSGAATLNAYAIAGSDDYDAVPTSWTVGSDTPSIAEDAARVVNVPARAQTAWVRLYLPPDVNDPRWSTLFTRARFTSGWAFGIGGAVPSEWDSNVGAYRQRLDYNTLANINDAWPGTPSGSDVQFRSHSILIRPVSAIAARTIAISGDSRSTGVGDLNDFYGWACRAAEQITTNGAALVGFESWSVRATPSSEFEARLNTLLRARAVDLVHWQPASSNNTDPWASSTVDTCIAQTARIAQECARRGIAFSTETMYPSGAADTVAKAAQWQRLNDHIRATYPNNFIDFERTALTDRSGAVPVLSAAYHPVGDPLHRNVSGHELSRDLAVPLWTRLLGL